MNVGIICVHWKPGSLSFYWNKIKTLQCALHPWRPNPDQMWHFPMAHLTCPILFPPATKQWEQLRTQPNHCQVAQIWLLYIRLIISLILLVGMQGHVCTAAGTTATQLDGSVCSWMIRAHMCILHAANEATVQHCC